MKTKTDTKNKTTNLKSKMKPNKKKLKTSKPKTIDNIEENPMNDDFLDDSDSSMDSDGEIYASTSHKNTLENLKEKDPEFYEYLQKHDKSLLEFDDDKIEDKEIDDQNANEDDLEEPQSIKITKNDVEHWKHVLKNPSSKPDCLIAIKSMIKSFRQTVQQSNPSDESESNKPMNLMNPNLFNLIINTCLVDLLPAIMHYLRLNSSITKKLDAPSPKEESVDEKNDQEMLENQIIDPRVSRNWKRVMPSLKMYLTDVIKMIDSLSIEARVSFQRHVLELIPFFNTFPHLLKRIIKRTIQEWYCSDLERSRVLAFLTLYRIIRAIQQNSHLNKSERQTLINHLLRRLYLAYVISSKTTNETTVGKIVFLRNSLVELYNLDHSIAYQQAFLFMRQLTINLRKSIMLNEKDSLKRVYNWQYVHSIELWSQLIGSTIKNNDIDMKLLAPITNISLETLRAFYAFKYVPFRFHIINSLIKLVAEVGCWVPILKTFCEIITQLTTNKNEIIAKNKKNKKKKAIKMETNSKTDVKKSQSNNKSINLDVMLKVSKEQSLQMEFIEKVVEKIYEQLLYFLKSIAHFASFPELVLIFINECRKKVKSIPYIKGQTIMRQLFDKCDENAKFIEKHRVKELHKNLSSLQNNTAVNNFEQKIKDMKPPLVKFYEQWKEFKIKQEQIVDEKTKFKMATSQELSSDQPIDSMFDADISEDEDYDLEEGKNIKSDDFEEEDDDEDIGEEIELTEEQMKKIQAKIEKEEKNLQNDGKRKRKKSKKRKNNRKARRLNANLKLEGAFELESSDDDP